jgi:glutamine synthetase
MYRKGGDNTFMPDGDDPQMPGKLGLQAIGGIVEHLSALTAVGCSTVNSYRRLWDTGFWAPVFAEWGFQNRTTGLRVSAPGRFEYRSVDSMVNPYIMGSVILAAADDGIVNKLDPGEPEERNIYEAMEAGKEVKKLPMSLGAALEALEKDEVVRRGMPGEMYRLYHEYKTDEWERFMSTVTDWDSETYMECLP